MDNRNKDWVRAYPLAPFAGKARKKEVDARLRFLKAFWLSSDTLSGRHTAEKEAVQVALDNLTGNSGLGNLDTRWFKEGLVMALPLLSQGEYKLQTASLAVFGRYVSAVEDNGILDNGQS